MRATGSARSMVVRVAIACLVIELGASSCAGRGCCGSSETANYESAYAKAISHECATFVYERPLAEAWPDILGVLAEFGFPLADKEPVEGKTLESSFKPAGAGDYRVLLRVVRLDAKRWRLTVDKQFRHVNDDGGIELTIESRAADPEIDRIAWTMAQRIEPARALEIERKAREKAERAAAVGRGCDRGCAACASILFPES